MTKTERFNSALARGLEFEQGEALQVLHRVFPEYYIINNKIDPLDSTNGRVVGPRMYRGASRNESHILPDFLAITGQGNNVWFDAKLKKRVYNDGQGEYFTLDQKKHQQYCNFPLHVRDNFYLIFKNETTDKVYIGKFDPAPTTKTFNNSWGVGSAPLYFLKDLTEV